MACNHGHLEIAHLLLLRGADPNAKETCVSTWIYKYIWLHLFICILCFGDSNSRTSWQLFESKHKHLFVTHWANFSKRLKINLFLQHPARTPPQRLLVIYNTRTLFLLLYQCTSLLATLYIINPINFHYYTIVSLLNYFNYYTFYFLIYYYIGWWNASFLCILQSHGRRS